MKKNPRVPRGFPFPHAIQVVRWCEFILQRPQKSPVLQRCDNRRLHDVKARVEGRRGQRVLCREHISADYYGMYCEALKRLQHAEDDDPPFVALMANSTSGDVNNNNFRTPRAAKTMPCEQMRFVAEDVVAKVNAALAKVSWKEHAELPSSYREAPLSWLKIEPALLDWAKEELRWPSTQPRQSRPAVHSNGPRREALAGCGSRARAAAGLPHR
jgi:hypothetical protein